MKAVAMKMKQSRSESSVKVYTQVEVCQVLGLHRGRGLGVCNPACCGGTGERCGVTAQPSLPTADKAVRHGRQLIPLLLNYWRRRDAAGVYDEARKAQGEKECRYWSWKMRALRAEIWTLLRVFLSLKIIS